MREVTFPMAREGDVPLILEFIQVLTDCAGMLAAPIRCSIETRNRLGRLYRPRRFDFSAERRDQFFLAPRSQQNQNRKPTHTPPAIFPKVTGSMLPRK